MIFYNNGNISVDNGYNLKEELDNLQKLVDQQEEVKKNSSFKLVCKR